MTCGVSSSLSEHFYLIRNVAAFYKFRFYLCASKKGVGQGQSTYKKNFRGTVQLEKKKQNNKRGHMKTGKTNKTNL